VVWGVEVGAREMSVPEQDIDRECDIDGRVVVIWGRGVSAASEWRYPTLTQ